MLRCSHCQPKTALPFNFLCQQLETTKMNGKNEIIIPFKFFFFVKSDVMIVDDVNNSCPKSICEGFR